MRYLLACSAGHGLHEFRQPELESIAHLHNFEIKFLDDAETAAKNPYILVQLESDEQARLLGSRAVSIKHVWRYWYDASTYDELHSLVKQNDSVWKHLANNRDLTWRFQVNAYGRTIQTKDQTKVVETFAYMDFLGDIRLKNSDVAIGVFEEYESETSKGRDLKDMKRVWMGLKVCDSQRFLVDQFDLKKRKYIGNTSMEAEVSLLMANQALAAPGKICYDPFAGTGSMLLTAAAFGAMTFGSDIDGRQMRGKKTGIKDSAQQYGLSRRILDCASFDMNQHPFRTGEIFDAILTDPPYGVRAGAKRTGRKEGAREVLPVLIPGREHEGLSHQLPDYVPPSIPWEMSSVINSLISYSLYMLKPGGRLVFFLPTNNEEYRDVDVPCVPGMKLISNSSQDFGKWARRLITMEKLENGWQDVVKGLDRGIERRGMESVEDRLKRLNVRDDDRYEAEKDDTNRKVGHYDFRKWYFEEKKQQQTRSAQS
ncbi:hypothetical protein OIO90_002351 [Microbotryomycetes sp. JL221]|nr:hypothetical protein OIO90_002351 [Microbotryomycetes sp. JL221]